MFHTHCSVHFFRLAEVRSKHSTENAIARRCEVQPNNTKGWSTAGCFWVIQIGSVPRNYLQELLVDFFRNPNDFSNGLSGPWNFETHQKTSKRVYMGVSLNGGTPKLHPKMIIFSRKTHRKHPYIYIYKGRSTTERNSWNWNFLELENLKTCLFSMRRSPGWTHTLFLPAKKRGASWIQIGSTSIFETITSWWFQPIWNILVKMGILDHFPR